MSKSQDSLIIQLAAEKSAVILTLDADFHTILAVSGAPGPSVIRVRIEGLDARAFVAVTQNVLAQLEDELKAGCLITVKAQDHLPPFANRRNRLISSSPAPI